MSTLTFTDQFGEQRTIPVSECINLEIDPLFQEPRRTGEVYPVVLKRPQIRIETTLGEKFVVEQKPAFVLADKE